MPGEKPGIYYFYLIGILLVSQVRMKNMMQIKKISPVKGDHVFMQSADKKADDRHQKLVAAKPREHVNPATRDKSVLGICNR